MMHPSSHGAAGAFGLVAQETILLMPPMFRANGAWGFTHAAPMVGAKLVLPGNKLDAASIAELIEGEGVNVTAGVPTLYNNLLKYLEAQGRGAGTLKRIAVAGSAPALRMIEGFERIGVSVNHVWGMTETSPSGTSPQPSRRTAKLSAPEQIARKTAQGPPLYGVDLKIADQFGNDKQREGKSASQVIVRRPWIT